MGIPLLAGRELKAVSWKLAFRKIANKLGGGAENARGPFPRGGWIVPVLRLAEQIGAQGASQLLVPTGAVEGNGTRTAPARGRLPPRWDL